jgi:hypothetical protein
LEGILPNELQQAAEMYAGCVSGAIQKDEYLKHIENTGFKNIKIQKEKAIIIPQDILAQYLDQTEIDAFYTGNTGILSVTVYAEKPEACCEPKEGVAQDACCEPKISIEKEACCEPGGTCC